jgi:hypothetical protein
MEYLSDLCLHDSEESATRRINRILPNSSTGYH